MQFFTENSLYEVDVGNKLIRRVSGKYDPTPRQGADGGWKHYVELNNLHKGQCALIVWNILEDGTKQATLTSEITQIESTVEEFKVFIN